MIKIGDFSRISRVSIKALRYYEQVGLLRPSHIDNVSGYRYYSARQLPRLSRILFFKKLGFSLSTIQTFLREDASSSRLRNILLARKAELLDNMRNEQSQLAEVETLLKRIEGEGTLPPPEVVVKKQEAAPIASIRATLAGYSELDGLVTQLERQVTSAQRVPGYGAIWHKCLHADGVIDCEALLFLRNDISPKGDFTVRELPSETVASVIHDGSDEAMPMVYAAAIESIDASGYEVVWPMRELYFPTAEAAGSTVTDVQFPIRRSDLMKSRSSRAN